MSYIDGCIERSKDNGMIDGRVSRKSECAGSGHDYANAIRKGRAWYVCPKCGTDISLGYVMWADAVHRVEAMGGSVTPNDSLVRCGECLNFRQISKYNTPPIGSCGAYFEIPIGFKREMQTIWTTTYADACKFYTPNATVSLKKRGEDND